MIEFSADTLADLPDLFTNEETPFKNRLIQLHLFSFQADWFICEYNPAWQNFYGMMVFRNDFKNARWGYFTLPELEELSKVTEIHWNKNFIPRAVKDLKPLVVKFKGIQRIYC
ncbi:hypothetical protein [Desulfospira joergensenii]|uniref:hypothetical protein n=1 Tax=Desulfospira joergensenii TaxID=53329 RepID=UPI0003B3CFF2|nr:hypothetical protein [Desulfospira joergensenii]